MRWLRPRLGRTAATAQRRFYQGFLDDKPHAQRKKSPGIQTPTYAAPRDINNQRLLPGEARRLGRFALVIGGSGEIGRYLCQELAMRHVQPISISRRGGVKEEHQLELDLLDEVKWVEGDVWDPSLWADLRELVEDVAEVYICLPRTEAGGEAAYEVVAKLQQLRANPKHIAMVSSPEQWLGLTDHERGVWQGAERLLQRVYRHEYLILRPGPLHYTHNPVRDLWNMVKRKIHLKLMSDTLYTTPESEIGNMTAYIAMSVERFQDTSLSCQFMPSLHAAQVAYAAVHTRIPNTRGGRVHELNTFGIQIMPYRLRTGSFWGRDSGDFSTHLNLASKY